MPLLSAVLLLSTVSVGHADDGKPSLVPPPTPYGTVQVWATVFDQDENPTTDPAGYGDPEDDPGFKIRRARLGLEGHGEVLRYQVLVGVSAPYDSVGAGTSESVQLVDASGGYMLVDGLWLDLGMQKAPVGREALMSSSGLALAERAALSEWITPGRQLGATVDYGTDDDFRYRVRAGVYNGDGGLFNDPDPGLMGAARAEIAVGPGKTYRTFGKVEGFTFGLGLDGWTDRAQATTTTGAGVDAMVRVDGLAVLIEARANRLAPADTTIADPAVLSETTRVGGLAQVGYSVGRFEPAVRVSMFDDDRDATDNGDVAEVLGGATWHAPKDTLRIGAGYVHRRELGGATTTNDTARAWVIAAF